MRLKAPLGMSTNLTARTPPTNPVDLWALCCVAHFLQNRSLPRICSSNDEHSELDIWDVGTRSRRRSRSWGQIQGMTTSTLLCTHGCEKKDWRRIDHALRPGACCYSHMCLWGHDMPFYGSTGPNRNARGESGAIRTRSCNAWTCFTPRRRSPRLQAFVPASVVKSPLSHLEHHADRRPSVANVTGARHLDNRQPMSGTTPATARSRVPVWIHTLAGDAPYHL